MNVKAETMLTLVEVVNESVEPQIALAAIEKLPDGDVADLLDLYTKAVEESGHRSSPLIKSAIRRLRERAPVEGEEPHS